MIVIKTIRADGPGKTKHPGVSQSEKAVVLESKECVNRSRTQQICIICKH